MLSASDKESVYIHSYFSAANLFRMEIDNGIYRAIISEMLLRPSSPHMSNNRTFHMSVYESKNHTPVAMVSHEKMSEVVKALYYIFFNDVNIEELEVENIRKLR